MENIVIKLGNDEIVDFAKTKRELIEIVNWLEKNNVYEMISVNNGDFIASYEIERTIGILDSLLSETEWEKV